ncbi:MULTISPECIES: TraK family protein [Caballeronia]|uniref:TraK family protein n=1 Tax=Caballeronia TaxID=1827195 RepID=UPI0019D3DDF4|nr:TraK family protein [Caballeronia grimmiae]
MSLSERIAAMVLAEPGRSPGPANRATFLSVRNEVQVALSQGWSILAIYKSLKADGVISFGYQAFRRYVNELVLRRT